MVNSVEWVAMTSSAAQRAAVSLYCIPLPVSTNADGRKTLKNRWGSLVAELRQALLAHP